MKKTTYLLFGFLNFFYNFFYANAAITINRNEGMYICAPGNVSWREELYIEYLNVLIIFISTALLFKGLYCLFNKNKEENKEENKGKNKDKKKGKKYIIYGIALYLGFYILVNFMILPFLNIFLSEI